MAESFHHLHQSISEGTGNERCRRVGTAVKQTAREESGKLPRLTDCHGHTHTHTHTHIHIFVHSLTLSLPSLLTLTSPCSTTYGTTILIQFLFYSLLPESAHHAAAAHSRAAVCFTHAFNTPTHTRFIYCHVPHTRLPPRPSSSRRSV